MIKVRECRPLTLYLNLSLKPAPESLQGMFRLLSGGHQGIKHCRQDGGSGTHACGRDETGRWSHAISNPSAARHPYHGRRRARRR